MSFSKSFNELFINPENESTNYDEKLFNYGENGDAEAINKLLQSADQMYLDDYAIYCAIKEFTLKSISLKRKRFLFDGLKNDKCSYIKDVKMKKNAVIIETGNETIKVLKLTDFIKQLAREDKDIETENREGKCHEKSVEISQRLPFDNDVVTGYRYGLTDKSKYLHSWIEFIDSETKDEFVIDYTLNAVINKKGYYQFQHAHPLSRISKDELKNDKKILWGNFTKLGCFNIKEYLIFRDEIMRDLKRKEDLLEEK